MKYSFAAFHYSLSMGMMLRDFVRTTHIIKFLARRTACLRLICYADTESPFLLSIIKSSENYGRAGATARYYFSAQGACH